MAYCEQVADQFREAGIRVEVDARQEKIGYKIREAQLQKIPYMLVVGDREVENNTLSVRKRSVGDIGASPVEEVISVMQEEISNKR